MYRTSIFSKWMAAILTVLLLSGALAGCGEKKDPPVSQSTAGQTLQDPQSSGSAGDDTPAPPPQPDEEELYRPAEKRFDRELVMLTDTNNFYYCNYTYDAEDAPTEICDVAIFQRQQLLQEQYGIDLVRLDVNGEQAMEKFNVAMGSGTKVCDVSCISGRNTLSAAVNGWLLDVNQMNHLNLDAPYWDQRIQDEYKIQNYLFCLEGDFNFIDDLRTYVTVYNDTMYGDLDFYNAYGTPYQLSADKKWTFETMMQMIADCGHLDSNADGKMDEKDTWGLVGENTAPYYFFLGSGSKLISNNKGTLEIVFSDSRQSWETIYNIIERVMDLNKSPDVIVASRPGSFSDETDVWGTASNIFKYNRALFRCTSLSAVIRLIDMEDDYGIMPIPAYTEGQDGYYCWVNPNSHYPLSFPFTSRPEIEELSEIVDTFAYHSLYGADSLNVAFYELLSFARLCRKPEDVEMLKLVFANKTYDIDGALQVTGAVDIISHISYHQAYDTLSSRFDEVKTSSETKMKELVSRMVANVGKQGT